MKIKHNFKESEGRICIINSNLPIICEVKFIDLLNRTTDKLFIQARRELHVWEYVHKKKGHCLFRTIYGAPITMRVSDVNNLLFVFNPTSTRC